MRTVVALVVFLAGGVFAAPVPKALKKALPTADGVWECVEYNYDGRSDDVPDHLKFCKVVGENVLGGRELEDGIPRGDPAVFAFRTDDPAHPTRQTLVYDSGWTLSAVVELDGDTFRWAISTERGRTLAECKPGLDVRYHVFQRVKTEK